jgi:hypothetical protein
MKNSQPILLSIPLILVGIGHVYYLAQTADGCWTAGQSWYLFFSYLFGGIFAFAASIVAIVKYAKERQLIQLLPLFTSVLLVLIFILNKNVNFQYDERTKAFQMQNREAEIDVFLFLNPDGECLLYTRTSGLNCYFTGQYELDQDTLHLRALLTNQKEGVIASAYVMGRDSVLRPIHDDGQVGTDSTTWLVNTSMEALN